MCILSSYHEWMVDYWPAAVFTVNRRLSLLEFSSSSVKMKSSLQRLSLHYQEERRTSRLVTIILTVKGEKSPLCTRVVQVSVHLPNDSIFPTTKGRLKASLHLTSKVSGDPSSRRLYYRGQISSCPLGSNTLFAMFASKSLTTRIISGNI